MESALAAAMAKLTDIQRQAVLWDQGPLLVFRSRFRQDSGAHMPHCRIAGRLRKQNFRILALTFTNKAADEMKGRSQLSFLDLRNAPTSEHFIAFAPRFCANTGFTLALIPTSRSTPLTMTGRPF